MSDLNAHALLIHYVDYELLLVPRSTVARLRAHSVCVR
eukprot:COSAG05_NODE_3734_length_1872_cov_1.697124_1_plen_37_part_10